MTVMTRNFCDDCDAPGPGQWCQVDVAQHVCDRHATRGRYLLLKSSEQLYVFVVQGQSAFGLLNFEIVTVLK